MLNFNNQLFDAVPDMPGPVPFWLDDLACRGNETALSFCPHSMWGKHDCSQNQAIGLACAGKKFLNRHKIYTTSSPQFTEPDVDPHDLRLVDGQTENSGRLEVLYGGVWGTVCGIGWDLDDADVACRQLGFLGALTLLGNDTISEGVGVVWLEGGGCHGNESRLTECQLSGWGLSQCDHTQDVGITCDGNGERFESGMKFSFVYRFGTVCHPVCDHTHFYIDHTHHFSNGAPSTSFVNTH